jgi:hypothetical protein
MKHTRKCIDEALAAAALAALMYGAPLLILSLERAS